MPRVSLTGPNRRAAPRNVPRAFFLNSRLVVVIDVYPDHISFDHNFLLRWFLIRESTTQGEDYV